MFDGGSRSDDSDDHEEDDPLPVRPEQQANADHDSPDDLVAPDLNVSMELISRDVQRSGGSVSEQFEGTLVAG